MNNERKLTRLRKQLEVTSNQNKELKCRNTALTAENNALKNAIQALQTSLEALNNEIEQSRADHIRALSDLKNMRSVCAEQHSALLNMKKHYRKEMERLLSRIRNNTMQKG